MNEIELLTPTKVIKTSRKSIAIIIENNGDLIVRSPIRIGEKEIYKFILSKKNWIIKKRLEVMLKPKRKLDLSDGAEIVLLGKKYVVNIKKTCRSKLLENEIILSQENAKSHLIKLLKTELLKIISKELQCACDSFDFCYKSISISSARTNWGSCSHDNRLHFSFRLMFTNLDVIRYIVIHELVHTKIKNHGRKFWKMVADCCRDYKKLNSWLKDNREIVDLI